MNTISFLIYSMEMGGTERVTHDLINKFISRGYDINLICMIKKGYFLTNLNLTDDKIFEIGIGNNVCKIMHLINKVKKIVSMTKTDSLIAMGEYPNIIAPFVKFCGKTIIVEHNTKTFYTAPQAYNLSYSMKYLAKKAYEKAKRILCVSQNIKDIITSKNQTFKDKTFVIYNPIDFQLIYSLSNKKIDYFSTKIKIINVGRLTEQKNIPLLLNAFKKIHDNYINTELWLVGNGPIKKQLQDLCKILNISDSVIFWGFQQNPYKFVKNANFFVSSSSYEGFGLVVFEALYLKKRVIVTRSISDYDNLITCDLGRVVPVDDEDALCDAMKKEIEENTVLKNTPEMLGMFRLKTIADKYLEYLQ